jgi:mono/diheme cytochrome c family protein
VGRSEGGDPSSGKALFMGKGQCASCHSLADAKANGKVGPNLDDAFEPDRKQGFDESTIRDVVRGQIAYPEPPMPANLVRGHEADDVAAYISKCAGVPACGIQATSAAGAPSSGGGKQTSGGGKPDGKQIFASAGCSGCHTLKAAGATGNVGPNLDRLKPPKAIVVRQVEHGGGAMPAFKGQLSPAQIDAVATFVSSSAGK